MILQRFLVDGQATQNHVGFPESQSVALDGIGVVGVLHNEFFRQPCHFALGQGTAGIQFSLLPVDHIQQTFSGAETAIGRLHGICRDLPATAFLECTGDFTFGAKNAHTAIGQVPLFGCLLYGDIPGNPS